MRVSLRGGIKDIKSKGEALVPAVKKGITAAYSDGLGYANGAQFGEEGGYVEKYSKFCFIRFSLYDNNTDRQKKS